MEIIGAEELGRRLSMTTAIDALELAFREQDPSSGPLRSNVDTPAGSLLLMPASGAAGVGVKLVTISPGNPERGVPLINAVYVVFDAITQEAEAVIDGAALTALRTAAVSGLATRWLANDDAARLVIFGSGVQATSHLEAMLAIRPIEHISIVSRGSERAEALAAVARGWGVEVVAGAPRAVSEADVVCTCTTAISPLFDGRWLKAGAHVNAVGTHVPSARELDAVTIGRAKVVVETREAALTEAGELVLAIQEGVVGPDHVRADLKEMVSGATVRTSREDVTVFKSVGLAFEDLAVARAALDAR
jgi:ornithine cyclodeaminase/alanine dehydrogenase-like protein (mu-crystallin family)